MHDQWMRLLPEPCQTLISRTQGTQRMQAPHRLRDPLCISGRRASTRACMHAARSALLPCTFGACLHRRLGLHACFLPSIPAGGQRGMMWAQGPRLTGRATLAALAAAPLPPVTICLGGHARVGCPHDQPAPPTPGAACRPRFAHWGGWSLQRPHARRAGSTLSLVVFEEAPPLRQPAFPSRACCTRAQPLAHPPWLKALGRPSPSPPLARESPVPAPQTWRTLLRTPWR